MPSRKDDVPASSAVDDRPNIIFIITDQQRWDTIAELGNENIVTPNLDRLVKEGTAFTHVYVTAPSCAPSRASLFTGLYPHTNGVYRNDDPWNHSWVENLAEAGYRCASIGKMHTFPYEKSVGFHERHVVENKDRSNPVLPYFLDNWDKALWARGEIKPDRKVLRDLPDYRESLGAFKWELPEDLHSDNFVGNLAQHWLSTYPTVSKQPFFLQIGFPGPHPPYDATERFLDLYEGVDLPLPVNSRRDRDEQPDALKALRREHVDIDHDGVVHEEDPPADRNQRRKRHYYANISMIDNQVGEILDVVERRGALDNTVVIFTSDHGDMLGDHGHNQKWAMYEGSVRVPGIVWGPGRVSGGEVVDSLISMFDFGATVLDLAEVPIPHWMEAQTVKPALEGNQEWSGRKYIFSEHARDLILTETALITMVRDSRWKLVEFLDSDQGQLFDLEADPNEEFSLWDDPGYSDIKASLQAKISAWRAESSLATADWVER